MIKVHSKARKKWLFPRGVIVYSIYYYDKIVYHRRVIILAFSVEEDEQEVLPLWVMEKTLLM
jgi:hypothetical protein